MKAFTYTEYGLPSQLIRTEVVKPTCKADDVLIEIHAVSLNASDVEFLTGKPAYSRIAGLTKPRQPILGSDVSGVVVEVGVNIIDFKVGDCVYGDLLDTRRCLTEFVAAPAAKLQLKPDALTHVQAANLPQASTVGEQSINYVTPVKAGERVLIIGGGGGSGCFAIQLAKAAGAHVTAVDNQHKQALMSRLGADVVIDYKQQNYTEATQTYDRIVDYVGSQPLSENRKLLSDNGCYNVVGGPLHRILNALVSGLILKLFSKKRMGLLLHDQSNHAIAAMAKKVIAGEVSLVAEPAFKFVETVKAFEHLHSGKSQGKVCIQVR